MKLRLLLFEECNRSCVGCCNKDWDLDSLERETNFTGYNEIMLTGGEPMLKPQFVLDVIKRIKQFSAAKIYMYTAKVDNIIDTINILNYLDGITLTLHEQDDVKHFIKFNYLLNPIKPNKSLRLHVFKGVDITGIDTSIWEVKSGLKWLKNCPLPKDEVFKKL